MTMLLRKTSAATALLGLVLLLFFLVLALMVSLRRFTDEREITRIGLSLDKRMGLRSGAGEGSESCGKDPGMMNFLKACLRLALERRLDLEYRVEDCGGNLASVHGTPRKSEKKADTSGDEYAWTTTWSPQTVDDFFEEEFWHNEVETRFVSSRKMETSRLFWFDEAIPPQVIRRTPRSRSMKGRMRAIRGYFFWLRVAPVP